MATRLIIGENSSLVRKIRSELVDVDYVSHRKLDEIRFEHYEVVFIFSWDSLSLDGNIKLLKAVPASKLVFVSTTAIFALQRRPQWNRYPTDKHAVEQLVLADGGSVLRLGVTDPAHPKMINGAFPRTTYDSVVRALNSWQPSSQRITNLFEIEIGGLCGWRAELCKGLGFLSRLLPPSRLFQLVPQGVAKALGFKSYGYTDDANSFFSEELLIGYGALGSYYDRSSKAKTAKVLVSGRPDERLNGNGFRGTLVGHGNIGLARLWHGVQTNPVIGDANLAKKIVPLWVHRPQPPRTRSVIAHAHSLSLEHGVWNVAATPPVGPDIQLFARRLVLAAGPIENARLMQSIADTSCTFSDHEIGMIGTCSLRTALQMRGIRKAYPLLLRSHSWRSDLNGHTSLIEFRPLVPEKHATGTNAAFYLDSTSRLVVKVLRSLSLHRLNEAFFNKYGVGFATTRCSVFLQVLVPNAIHLVPMASGQQVLTRRRLGDEDWRAIVSAAQQLIPDLVAIESVGTVDGQHILGGAEIRQHPLIERLCDQGLLRILGSPTTAKLDALHHTRGLQEKIDAAYSPLTRSPS